MLVFHEPFVLQEITMNRIVAPYGSWVSPVAASLLTSAGVSLGQLCVDGSEVYWSEGRPLEGGRVVIAHICLDQT